jgi:hypothetical protein
MSAWQEEQSKVWDDIVRAARRIKDMVDLISVDSGEGTELREKMEIVKLITHAQV